MIFDGVSFAREIETKLKSEGKLMGKKLLIVGNEESVYVRLKKEMGERLGVEVRVVEFSIFNSQFSIGEYGGVVVQLPVADVSVLERIPVGKDVDGLNEKSGFLPAAVVAVKKIIDSRFTIYDLRFKRIAVVGARGMVGRRMMEMLKLVQHDNCCHPELVSGSIAGFDKGDDLKNLKDFDVVISATGSANLITRDMVKEGVVAIDLGYPKGDFAKDVAEKTSFFTPVPGGVGPVTIACLYENLALV